MPCSADEPPVHLEITHGIHEGASLGRYAEQTYTNTAPTIWALKEFRMTTGTNGVSGQSVSILLPCKSEFHVLQQIPHAAVHSKRNGMLSPCKQNLPGILYHSTDCAYCTAFVTHLGCTPLAIKLRRSLPVSPLLHPPIASYAGSLLSSRW